MIFSLPARPAFDPRFTALLLTVTLLGALCPAAATAQQEAAAPTRSHYGNARRPLEAGISYEAPQAGSVLSLEAALDLALQANPEILAAMARVEAAEQRPAQAHSLADPMLNGVIRNVGFGGITIGEEMMSQAGIRLTQAFPYRGKRDLGAAVAKVGVDVAASQSDLIMLRVVRNVAEAYFELGYLDRAVDIVENTQAYLINLEQTAEARYAVGEGIQQDVLKAQVEISVLLNRLVILDQQRESVETGLNRLLDRPVAADIGVPAAAPVPDWNLTLQSLEADAIASSAILRERARRVEQRQATLELRRRDTKPDWIISGAWMSRGDLPSIWEANVGITLPIHKSDQQDRAIVEAEAELRASQFDHRDGSNVVAAVVRDLYLRADRAARLVQLYGEAIIPQATLSLESATAGYEVGNIDFLTVLHNVVTLLTYQLEYYRQTTDYMQALAGLEEHVGHSLGVTPATIMGRLSAAAISSDTIRPLSGGER